MTLIERLQQALSGTYRVERELPLGGLGRLFVAQERATSRQVVVQVLPPDVAARTDAGRLREAIARAAALRHPSILPVVGAGGEGDLLWCISRYAAGESLRFRLLREGVVMGDEAVQLLRDAADALSYGHARGVCHGDLKPENIYLRDGRAVLTDFGVLCALHAAGGGEGAQPDPAADVRALAAVGRAMLSGGPGGAMPAPVAEVERFTTAAAFRDALGETRLMRRRRRRLVLGTALAAVLVAGAVLGGAAWRARARLEPDRLVLAPFEVLTREADAALWREGLVDVLSANLDGAGPIHTVPPSVAIRQWDGRYDVGSAVELGRRTGARLAVFGRLVRTGGDSIRLTARLLDVATGGGLAELQLSDPESRIDRLADSLTVRLLRELGRSRPIGAVRRVSLGSSSLPALKSYLAGEQFYRRSEWDSALASYERAIALDSTFALPHYRAGIVLGWVRVAGDSLSSAYLMRAAALNRGLPTRDSMLLVAESLGAAVDEGEGPHYWGAYRRLYATVAEATRRYPLDPEVWYEAAEVRYHYPFFSSLREMRAAFDRAIALDSAFAPAYIHPVELALQLDDLDGARRYVDAYLRLTPRDIYADGVRLTRLLLDPRTARSNPVREILDTASSDLLASAMQSFRGWADTLETGVMLARRLVDARPGSHSYRDPEEALSQLQSSLAHHGRIREALAAGPPPPWLVGSAAMMGILPSDSAGAVLRRSLRTDPLWPRSHAVMGAPWFAAQRDTASLRELARRADSLAQSGGGGFHRPYGAYLAGAARALLLLARGDTATAVNTLLALPDTACERCVTLQVTRGMVLERAGRDQEAAAVLGAEPPGFFYPTDGLWMLARARVAERMGNAPRARSAYRYVRDVWSHADPELQPAVEEARAALARLRER